MSLLTRKVGGARSGELDSQQRTLRRFMNLFSPFPLDATQAPRWHCLQRSATVALFLLPALMLSIPSNVLVFGWLLLLTSLGGIDCLWRARLPAKPSGPTSDSSARHSCACQHWSCGKARAPWRRL